MRHLNRLHLNGLRAVETVGRLQSLSLAAQELGVTPGAVSQHIARCERQLGHMLFRRTPRGMLPTEIAADFLARLTRHFSGLDAAIAALMRNDDAILTISVAPVLASKWLVPRLTRFAEQNPGLQLRLDASTALVDLDSSDIDLALRVGRGDWQGVALEHLLDQEVFPVCAPSIAARMRKPADILRHPIVSDANSNISWQAWLEPYGLNEKDLHTGNSFTDASLALDAAIAGQGIMLAWPTLAEYALRTGTLAAPFPFRAKTGNGYYIVSSATRRDSAKVRAFKAWLREEVQNTRRYFE